METIIDLQCKKYHQQTPEHAQVDFVFEWHEEVINLRDQVDDRGVETEVNQPLVFGEVSEMDDIVLRYADGFELNVEVAGNMERR